MATETMTWDGLTLSSETPAIDLNRGGRTRTCNPRFWSLRETATPGQICSGRWTAPAPLPQGGRSAVSPLSMHDPRHTFASHLIRSGADVHPVSRQLGHSRASITLDLYAGEFDEAQNAEALRERLTAAFGD